MKSGGNAYGLQHCLTALTETTGKRAVQAFARTVAKNARRLKKEIKEFLKVREFRRK
jgi:hypothetical protein